MSRNIVYIGTEIDRKGNICDLAAIDFDLERLNKKLPRPIDLPVIDTLYLSALLFAKRPYHYLVKNYKLADADINNPLSDARLCRTLFHDECQAFTALDKAHQSIYAGLLGNDRHFGAFFQYVGYRKKTHDLKRLIRRKDLDEYDEPKEIALVGHHEDVGLDYFRGKEKITSQPRQKGYTVSDVVIRFVAAWKKQNDPKSTWIVLPEITMRKTDHPVHE